MITKYEKANKGKLLVAVLALFVVLAGAAVVFSDSDVSAANDAESAISSPSYDPSSFIEAFGTDEIITLGTNVTVTGNLTDNNALTGKTIYCQTYTLTVQGDVKGGIFYGVGQANGSNGILLTISLVTTGTAKISDATFNVTASPAGSMPFAINSDDDSLTIENCTFSGASRFGAIHTNTGNISVSGGSLGNGIIVLKENNTLSLTSIQNVVISAANCAAGNVSIATDDITLSNASISEIILGWDRSTIPTATYNGGEYEGGFGDGITLVANSNVTGANAISGFKVSKADAMPSGKTANLTVNENFSAYGGDGIKTTTIASGKTFTVAPGESYNGETITGAGNLVAKGATVNSTVTTTGNVTMDGIALGNDLIAIQDAVLPISGNAYLTEDLVIPSDKTLSFVSGSTLEMNGHSITVQGTLNVEYGAVIKSNGAATEKILLDRNGTITNEGTIGYGVNAVTVEALNDSNLSYAGQGSVQMQNVSGVVLSVVNSGTGSQKPLYILSVTGSVYAEDDSQDKHEVTINNARITGDMVIGQGVTLIITNSDSAKTYLYNGASLTVDGTLNAAGLVMKNGSVVNLNGTIDSNGNTITAETGDYEASDAANAKLATSTVMLVPHKDYNINGLVLTVGQVNYIDDSTGTSMTMISQRLYLSGTVTGVYTGDVVQETTPNLLGTITVTNTTANDTTGNSYIAADQVLSLGQGINMVGGGTEVLGQIQYVYATLVDDGFVGTQYRVDATSETGARTTTYYITTFENAYSNIANAYQTTINVNGNLDIEIDVDLQAKQRITFNGIVDIAEENTVTVRSQASIGQINDVQGTLVKYNGASCSAPTKFVVEKKTNEYTSWSGLGPAIANAQAGDVIDVKNNGTVKNDMTIPAGVAVNIDTGATLTFERNLTIAETAKLVNEGGIDMAGDKSVINVDGELESYDGTIAFSKAPEANRADSRAINANGTATVDLSKISVTAPAESTLTYADVINGAAYLNNDNQTVITNVTAAVAGVEATDAIQKSVTLYGNINDASDITLGAGTILTVDRKADVVLGTVTLTAGETGAGSSISATTGEITATVSSAVGVIELDSAENVTVGVVSYTSTDGSKVDYMTLKGTIAGSVTVASGKVNADALIVDGAKTTLTVASGATLAVEAYDSTQKTLTVGASGEKFDSAALIVDGTLLFDNGLLDASNISGTDRQIIQINGTMTLADDAEVTVDGTLNVTGTLDISTTADKEATLTVNKYVTVGTEPTTVGVGGSVSGQISLADRAFVLAYAGADVSGMAINPNQNGTTAVDTEYYINETLYMTAYAKEGTTASLDSVLDAPAFKISGFETKVSGSDGYDITDITDWTNADGSDASGNIGSTDAVYITLDASTAKIQISIGTGIAVYIDGVRYSTGAVPELSVGTHDIDVSTNPGYSGTATITFNGQAITGGTFEVTSEMAGTTVVLTVAGDISVDSGSTGSSDDGMGIVEILLVILVVVVVILAIIVVLRMMRS